MPAHRFIVFSSSRPQRLKVDEQPCPVSGAPAERHVHDDSAAACFPAAEQVNLAAEVRIRGRPEQFGVRATLLFDGGKHEVEVQDGRLSTQRPDLQITELHQSQSC